MSRRDFEAAAAAIKKARPENLLTHYSEGKEMACQLIAEKLADHFAEINPRFDRQQFLEATGQREDRS